MYHDPKLMLKVHHMIQAGFSYRTTARKLGITKDKVARIMKQFKKGRVKIENSKAVRVVKPTLERKTHANQNSLLLRVQKPKAVSDRNTAESSKQTKHAR